MFKKEYLFVFILCGLAVAYVVISFIVLITRGKWGVAFHKKLALGTAIVALCAILNTGTPSFAQEVETPTPTPAYGTLTPVYGTIPPEGTPTVEPTSTPTPRPAYGISGSVWFKPQSQDVGMNDEFTTEVHVDAGTQLLAAYGITVNYDENKISFDDVEPGPDGFLAAVNDTVPGTIRISGFDTTGTGPGSDLSLLTIAWTAGSESGITILELIVDTLADEKTDTIGVPTGINGSVTIIEVMLGDVNGDDTVDIIDALLVAQYYVGLDPSNINLLNADVDASGEIDIIDALLIAQKYVGLIDKFPGE
ncbi:MAG: hypothetical protein JXB88_05260 [Spirochaetales bacterium]|nr:hypothetical protein [Spirochaetales bacterium]